MTFLFKPLDNGKPKKEKFFTQEQMLKNKNLSRGVCGQLANAWLEARMNNKEPAFLSDEDETFKVATKTLEAQAKMEEKGGTAMRRIAFINTQTPHDHGLFATKKLTTSEGVEEVMGKSRYALVGYPTKFNNTSHMVAFENDDGKGQCRMFDANMYLGEAKGNCAEIRERFAMMIKARRSQAENSDPSYVVLSQSSP